MKIYAGVTHIITLFKHIIFARAHAYARDSISCLQADNLTVRVLILDWSYNVINVHSAPRSGAEWAHISDRGVPMYGHPMARGTTWGRQICLSRKCPSKNNTLTYYRVRLVLGYFWVVCGRVYGGITRRVEFSPTKKHPPRPKTTRRRPWFC